MSLDTTSPLAADKSAALQRIQTGHIVGQPATGSNPLMATVVQVDGPNHQVTITITGFSETAAFTCNFEPRFYWNGSENVENLPPVNIPCLAVFPSNDPENVGWVIAFLKWPTQ